MTDTNERPGTLRPMLLNAFDMACAGHIQQGMYGIRPRHQDSHSIWSKYLSIP